MIGKIRQWITMLLPRAWQRIASLVLIGAALVTILSYFGIAPFPSNSKTVQLTIFIRDSDENPALIGEGMINVLLKRSHRNYYSSIGEGARVIFEEIGERNLGDSLVIGLNAKGWETVGQVRFIFTGDPIILRVSKDNSLKGVIRTRNGDSLIPKVGISINSDTTIFSKEDGSFKVLLPKKYWVDTPNLPYNLTFKKDGYKVNTELCYPNTEVEIRLSPK